MPKTKRAALYLRVSTDGQTTENQRLALEAVCGQRGWQVVQAYLDNAVSGAKGRDQRPGLDAMLKDASRGRFDVVLAWALDRLGRSLIDLLDTLGGLDAASVALVLHQQALDTTTPAGRMFFQVTGAFAEFERGMIRSRVLAGLEPPGHEACSSGDQERDRRRRPPYANGWRLERALRKSPRLSASATAPLRGSSPEWLRESPFTKQIIPKPLVLAPAGGRAHPLQLAIQIDLIPRWCVQLVGCIGNAECLISNGVMMLQLRDRLLVPLGPVVLDPRL